MADNCGSYVSADDLQAAKQSILHIEHVATSKDAQGNPALTVTDTIRGNNVTNTTLDGLFADIGFKPVNGSFEDGGTINNRWEVLLYESNGQYYQWMGTLPKTVPAGSTPTSTGGIGPNAWVDRSDLTLRSELAGDNGYLLIPSVQIQAWKRNGDVRGWGAVCNGTTDDTTAILQAIADTNGRIFIPGDIKVNTHILVEGETDVSVTSQSKINVYIDTGFTFNPSYRGIFVFKNCVNISTSKFRFHGAKLDKVNAPEPWQDGDCGIEYINCSGVAYIDDIWVKDVKTWGVIHVECPELISHVSNSYFENCQVQSGVGGTGYKALFLSNCEFVDCGLYGGEFETRDDNKETTVSNCIARLCNKGFASVHNTNRIFITGCRVINCKTGVSFLSDDSGDESRRGDDQIMSGCVATSCKTSFELVYPRQAAIINCIETRDDIDYYVRTRALDRIVKFTGSKAFVALDSATENPNITVGMVIQLDDGVQYTIATVDSTVTTDSVFGNMIGFTTTTALPTTYLRSSFRRYVQVSTDKTSVVLYGGNDVTIKGNKFAWATQILASYGNHTNLLWEGNSTYSCANYVAIGLTGTVTGSMKIEKGENVNIGSFGGGAKFGEVLSAERTYIFRGGTSNAETQIQHAFTNDNAWIGRIKCAINSGQSTTGTITLKINGSDVISGGFTGTPLRANAVLPSPINISDVSIMQLTDTVGDLVASGYSVTLYGAFLY